MSSRTSMFKVVHGLLGDAEVSDILDLCANKSTRRALDSEHLRGIAIELKKRVPELHQLTPVLASFFVKTNHQNWFVAPHQDLVIPVRLHHQKADWVNPTFKENIPFIQPPNPVLEEAFALRIQLDPPAQGDLRLHLPNGKIVEPYIRQGSALLMSPLVFHSSPKLPTSKLRRRVLHILYGPQKLPEPFQWYCFAA